MIEKNKWVRINERSRAYHWGNGDITAVYDLIALQVSSSGYHYLESVNGSKHIIAPGWRSITVYGEWADAT